ncbi:MAG: hypothetical protein KDC27_01725 [Acidobacteria bacterium]|nr:hypothetical protein [Acidobacteriota bacterium]
MSELERLQVRKRPLAAQERADMEREARDSERFMLGHWGRALRRWSLFGVVTLLALLALTWAALHTEADPRKFAITGAVGATLFLGVCAWELQEARARVGAVREAWARRVREASEQPVVEITVRPVRVWGSADTGWIFDLADGRALFADWDLPSGAATERIVAAVSSAGGVWFDQDGPELEAQPFPYSWEDVRDDHPLLEMTGPVLFRLDRDASASFRDFFEPEWLVPPAPRNSD